MKIYLTRHGQDIDNANGILNGHRDEELTDLGINQAKSLALSIKKNNLEISKIFSSPLSRAYKTAEIITKLLNLPKPKKINLLIERDFGTMTGKLVKDVILTCAPDIYKTKTISYFLSPEGAETFPQLILRANKLLNFIDQKNSTKNILLVCHGDIGKMIYAAFYELDWKEVLSDFHFGNADVFLLEKESFKKNRHIIKMQQHNH